MSMYDSAFNAQRLLVQAFSQVLESQLITLSALQRNNATTAAATMLLAKAVSAPRYIMLNDKGQPVGVKPITEMEE